MPLVPEHLWQVRSLAPHCLPNRDQDGYSSCVAYAGVKALRTAARILGVDWPVLSEAHLYGRINHGRDNGAWLADALIELTTRGAPDADLIPDDDWRFGQGDSTVAGDASLHRILEFWDCPSVFNIMAPVQAAHPVAAAFDIGQNFLVDDNNWVLPKRGSAGGHAILIVGCDKNPRDGEWGFEIDNSWGDDWGNHGHAFVPLGYFQDGYTDAWAITSVVRN